MINVLNWDIYEISATSSNLEGIMLRGRIRKFALINNLNLLTENASDDPGKVRFAVVEGTDASLIISKVKEMISDAEIKLLQKGIPNPVLSKLKVNLEDRYTL